MYTSFCACKLDGTHFLYFYINWLNILCRLRATILFIIVNFIDSKTLINVKGREEFSAINTHRLEKYVEGITCYLRELAKTGSWFNAMKG